MTDRHDSRPGSGEPSPDNAGQVAPGADIPTPGSTEVSEQQGIGVPDALQRLWTPHRMSYIQGENKPKGEHSDGCPFCLLLDGQQSDDETLIVARDELVFAVLNLYPYNPGHLMVLPYRHVADYTDLTAAETVAVAECTQRAMRVIRSVSAPHGFNIGLNQGPVAGAGIAAHLHQHVVPRWGGDSNFMPVIGHTRVLPQLLGDTRRLLADAWQRVA
ncbi:ATP adenylyltransferase [Haloactinomyces albus]|uniref:ATP adenylyltransferase n=1 Tax=Haloactinomyces albus TaxID=1352928 RepID=A0AAE3ZG36_9ACTN|nr:HIT domain-containing protein [Haloactinomyces albus]MDR7303256.1 ATP adenylyltransferase [Haloactinomyces albus]